MAIYATLINRELGKHTLQEITKDHKLTNLEILEVMEVRVSGEELEDLYHKYSTNPKAHPYDRVSTIPFPNDHSQPVSWYGDTAKFIVGNL